MKPNSDTIYRNRVLCTAPISNTTAAIADLALSISLLFPTGQHSGGGYGAIGTIPPNFYRIVGVFDQFRVKSLKCIFIPNSVDIAAGVSATPQPITVFEVKDYDDNSLVTLLGALNDGMAPKGYANGKARTIYMSPQRSQRAWLNCSLIQAASITASLTPGTGMTNQNLVVPNALASLKFMWPAVGAMTNIGSLVSEWDVEFKGVLLN